MTEWKWTKEEDDILRSNWNNFQPHDLKIWKILLPNRTYCSIKKRSRILGIKRDLSKFSKKSKFKCKICGKEFKGYGNRTLCSRECTAKYMSQNRVGENNPSFNPNKEFKSICRNCGKEFIWYKGGTHDDRVFCSIDCVNKFHSKENHPNWLGGIQYYPYSDEFDKKLKESIKKRDLYSCRLCGNYNGLCVHHIDYDKQNCDNDNLITLCRSCHSRTNFDRNFWEIALTFLTTGYEVVTKSWGFEFIPVNNDDYCLKALVFWEGQSFSNHYHEIKKESWYLLHGKMLARLTFNDVTREEFVFKKGEVLDIGQGVCHQLKAIDNTILIEISTQHFDSDSYRIEKSGKCKNGR